MVNAVGALSSIFSFASLILVAIAIGTNFWVRVDNPRVQANTELNPPVLNDAFSISYDLDHLGLWVGCHRALVRYPILFLFSPNLRTPVV